MAVGTCQGSQPLGLTQVVETVGVTPAIPPGGVGGGGGGTTIYNYVQNMRLVQSTGKC